MGADSLYYIMDYSGNYYRTNYADQLVAVAGEQDATVFTFAQANSRICVGKKAAFYCMVPIEDKTGDTEIEEAENEEVEENLDMFIPKEQEKMDEDEYEYVSHVKELTYDEVTDQVEKNVSSYDLSEMDWAEYLTHFTYLVASLKDYRDDLAKKHSDIDQKICDILHYIELCETNDEEAIDLVELLRVCRENRRDIKDELQRIEYFQNNLGTNANAAKAKQALKCIKGLETRKYKPRKYEELFENCILKDKRLQRDDIYETGYSNENRKQKFSVQQTYEGEGGEVTMHEERQYTPFDGKENDWLSFAKQQVEFYRNARQYIRNLQLDINEIDEEIEDILRETEDANCNVAQGYKFFKRLKELRLEKKAKSKELDCLYALTDYIDCDALADTCEANLTEVKEIMEVSEQSDVTKLQPVDKEQEEIHVVENIKGVSSVNCKDRTTSNCPIENIAINW
jgi:hypothetical protein